LAKHKEKKPLSLVLRQYIVTT